VNDHFRRTGRELQAIGGTDAVRFFEQVPVVEPNTSSSMDGLEKEDRQIQNVMLRQALENIRPCFSCQTWTAFWMVVVDGREAIDVAKDLAMRPGTVRVAKSRVLKRLRLEMGEKD
jgi:RNA polymerase sigma-70 factor (ECF subfamily)